MTQVSLTTSTNYDGPLNALVEAEGTILTIRFDLDEPAPAGGLKIFFDSDIEQSLGRLNLPRILVPSSTENINTSTITQGLNDDVSGVAVEITEGSTFATITLPVFDNNEPADILPETFDGLVEVTYNLLTRNQISAGDLNSIESNGTPVSEYTVNSAASSSLVYFADTADQLPTVNTPPTVSISASPTDLVEEEGTLTTLTISVSELPASGEINVTLDSDIPRSLAEFDVTRAVYDGGFLSSANADSSGFTVTLFQPTATIQLAPFDDPDDEGPQNITYTLQPSDDYTIDSAASSISINIDDNDGFTGPGYSEAASGDISGDRNNPTQLALVEGANTLLATSGDGDIDYLTVNVPDGFQLDSIVLNSYTSPGDQQAFVGVQSGTTFTEPSDNADPGNLLGYTLFGPGNGTVGEDILDNMGSAGDAIGFSGALASGNYTFWLQQLGGATDYELEFNVSPEPPPSDPVVSFSATPTTINEAEGTALVMNFSVDGDIPPEGITVKLEGDAARIMQQFTVAQTRFDADTGEIFYRFDNDFANNVNGNIVGGTLDRFSLEDGDPSETASNEAAAGNAFLSNFTFTITEPTASITIPVIDDLMEEESATYTYNLVAGDGYTVDSSANSATFTVTDGVVGGGGPTVGVSAAPTTLFESEQTAVTLTFTTAGDIPPEGLVVVLEGSPRALTEFDVNASNPRDPEDTITIDGPVVNGGSIVGTDETAGSLIFRITDPTATVTVPVFQDELEEGAETLTFNLQDGEAYNVDQNASAVSVTIEDINVNADPVVSFSVTPTTISEAEGTALVMNFTVDGDIPPEGITVNLEGDAARIMQQFTVAQTRFNEDGETFNRFDNGFANNDNGNIVGGTLDRFSLEDGDPSETASNEAAAGTGFLSNFSFTITEANASITIPVIDDVIQEEDATYTYTLVDGDGYTVDSSANSGTFTVTDGVPGGGGPTVGVSAEPTTLFESEQTAVTLTFTTDGDIPPEGLVVVLEGSPRAIAEFDVTASNPRDPEDTITIDGPVVTGGNIVGTNEVVGSLFFRITDPTATVTVPVFQDDIDEGTETLTFNLQDGELYNVDQNASAVSVTIEDVKPPTVSFSATPTIISEAEGTALVMNFSVDGEIPPEGITVNLEGDAARIMQQFTVAQTRFNDDGETFNRFDNGFANNDNGNIVGGTLDRFSLEDGDPSETASNEAAAGTGFLSNFSFTITEPTASITIPVIDDVIQEEDATYTYTLVGGDGYIVDESVNSATFTVTDGVVGGGGPTVGVSAEPTTLVESEQTAVTLTFTTDGEIPPEGLVVVLEGPPRSISEFDVNASNPRDPEDTITIDGPVVTGGNIVGTNEVVGALFFRITDPTATVTVPVFQDDIDEGTETFTFNLQDGELYNVDQNASAVSVTIEDNIVPEVSLSITPDEVSEEGPNNAFTATFTVNGEIPPAELDENGAVISGGLQVLLDVKEIGALGEQFDDFTVDGLAFGSYSDPERPTVVSFVLLENTSSITLSMFNDVFEEQPFDFNFELLEDTGNVLGAEYIVTDANSGSFTLIDGNGGPGVGPTVGISVSQTELTEGDEFTVNFNVNGEIPAEGLQVVVQSPTARALGEFAIFDENNNPLVSTQGIAGFPEPYDGQGSSFLVTLTEADASMTLKLFEDGPDEGEETLTFDLVNGEEYEVDPAASSVSLTINDGGEDAVFDVESGVTSVFLDLPLLETATGIQLVGADSEATPFSDDFQVGFAIAPETDFGFAPVPFAPVGGTIEHSGTITLGLGDAQVTIGDFSIGFDPARVSETASGFFVADTLDDPLGLEVLFDISVPGVVSVSGDDFEISDADLLLAPELATALGQSELAGTDIGDARVDAVVDVDDTPPVVAFSADKTVLVESNQDFIELSFNVDGRIPAEGLPVSIKVNTTDPSQLFFVDFSAGDFEFESGTPNVQDPGNIWELKGADDGTDSGLAIVKNDDIFAIVEPPYDTINLTLTQNTASIRLPILDDTITEANETVTFTLEAGDGYTVADTNAPITVTLRDGDPVGGDGPTVSLSANATKVVEGQEITFTIDLDEAPSEDGVRVLIDSDIVGSTGEFAVSRPRVDTDGDGVGDTRFVEGVTLTGVADPFSLQPNEDGSGFFVTVTEQQATLKVTVADDGIEEGTESFTYKVVEGEDYNVSSSNGSVTFSIEDGPIPAEAAQVEFEANENGEVTAFAYEVTGVAPGETANASVSEEALEMTDAAFDNLVGFYEVIDINGGIDTNGDGVVDINPGDAGYAKAALENAVDGMILRLGGNPDNDTSADEFDAVVQGGTFYAPFAIANAGDLTVEEFLTINPDNMAATEVEDQVAYFAYIGANPDGANHLKSWGDGVFGFEDLPSNLAGVSDNDFNDAVFKFNFTA